MKVIILSIALTAILVSLPVHSSVIRATNGVIDCDGLICPEGSTSCIVSRKSCGDLSSYKYIRMCSDANGVPTDSKAEELKNPDPTKEMNEVSVYGGNRVLSAKEREELEERIEKVVQDTTNYWNKWTSDFTANMEKMFPPGFPFVK